MNPDNANSATNSATTSSSGHEATPGKAAAALSEADYLTRQADAAKAAIAQTWAEVKGKLGQTANVRPLLKQHPWIALGSAAVAGFAAASTVVPSKEDQALRKLAALEEAFRRPAREKAAASPSSDGNGKAEAAPRAGGLTGLLMRELIGAIKPTLVSLLTAGISSHEAKDNNPPQDSAGGDFSPPVDPPSAYAPPPAGSATSR